MDIDGYIEAIYEELESHAMIERVTGVDIDADGVSVYVKVRPGYERQRAEISRAIDNAISMGSMYGIGIGSNFTTVYR